uniref:Uncharacterized protein n=1 Tax=Megaselia scalaris TaxID=36166 RepID=T1GCR2_MEGSC
MLVEAFPNPETYQEAMNQSPKTILNTDNQGTLQLTKNSSFHSGIILMNYVGTNHMTAYIFTKALPKHKIEVNYYFIRRQGFRGSFVFDNINVMKTG